MKQVKFKAIEKNGIADGTYGWSVYVGDKLVIANVHDMDIGNSQFDPIWEALGAECVFDWE